MVHNAQELLVLAAQYEDLATEALVVEAKKKEKKKLDPKAKVRNRGTVCVPASSAKDKKDHFPINSESQARNALARVHQYSAAPPWYNGSLKSLQELVSRKVHSKYKGIGKSDKKKSSSLDIRETVLDKYAQTAIPEVNFEDLPKAPVPVESLPRAPKYPPISPDVQKALNQALHLNLKTDGEQGPETTAALEQFKAKYSKVYNLIGSSSDNLLRKWAQSNLELPPIHLNPPTPPNAQDAQTLAGLKQVHTTLEGLVQKARASQNDALINELQNIKQLIDAATYQHSISKTHR